MFVNRNERSSNSSKKSVLQELPLQVSRDLTSNGSSMQQESDISTSNQSQVGNERHNETKNGRARKAITISIISFVVMVMLVILFAW